MDSAIMSEAHEQALGRLADRMLKYACHLLDEGEASDDRAEKARLGEVAAKLGRGVRQTIALQSKLAREARGDARAEEGQRTADAGARLGRHQERVCFPLRKLIWSEHERESDEAEMLIESLDWLVDEESCDPAFLQTPIEVLVPRLARQLDLEWPDATPTSPNAAALAGGGPSAGEPMVEGASPTPKPNGHTQPPADS
ncbi:MAG: hypothetical protein ACJ798_08335, partial [Phenylobacterium sp.]